MAAGVTGRAAGLSMRNIDLEGLTGKRSTPGRRGLAGAGPINAQPSSRGPMQPRAGDVAAIGIKFGGPSQAALGLRLQGLIQARLIHLGDLLK